MSTAHPQQDPAVCDAAETVVESVRPGMGTVITQQAFGEGARDAVAAAEAELERLEHLLSRFRDTSEVADLNRHAGERAVAVSPETIAVLGRALEFADLSNGLLDVTIAPLVSLWGDAARSARPPGPVEIEAARALIGHRDLVLDQAAGTACLRLAGQCIDLGGIGKGYAADAALDTYRRHGIESAYVNLGGNVAALGGKPDGSPWRVGIRHPRSDEALLGVVSVTNRSVVTSGDYQRFFLDSEGVRHHHILDPATGRPSASGLTSVTVVAEDSCAADALSTIVFVAGLERGLDFVRGYPSAEAVLVDSASRVFITPGLAGAFQPAYAITPTIV